MENALYAALHRFLVEKKLEKSAKALLRETKVDVDATPKVAFDLEEAFKPLFEKHEEEVKKQEKEEKKSKKKRSRSESDASEAPPKKRKKSEEKEKKEKKKDKKEKKDKKKEEEKKEEKKEEEKKEEEKKEEEKEDETMEEPETPRKKEKKQITPFRRVKEEEIHIERAELRDNTYYAKYEKGGDSWGYKANKDLEKTRGKGFRHEKTKKKRGSYRGGTIDPNHVASVKFTYSDDEE